MTALLAWSLWQVHVPTTDHEVATGWWLHLPHFVVGSLVQHSMCTQLATCDLLQFALQLKDWKARHKQECAGASGASAPSAEASADGTPGSSSRTTTTRTSGRSSSSSDAAGTLEGADPSVLLPINSRLPDLVCCAVVVSPDNQANRQT
jgi:hypothetical protein